MGYSSWHERSKKDFVNTILRDWARSETQRVLKYKSTSEGLWILMEYTKATETRSEGYKHIVFHKIESRGKGEWAEKSMSESCHPYYYSCPAEYLKEAPVENQDWRNKVAQIEENKNRAKNMALGTKVQLYGKNYEVVGKTNRWLVKSEETGMTYGLKRTQLKELVFV